MMDQDAVEKTNLLELTTEIVSAYCSNNAIKNDNITNLIQSVHASLVTVAALGSVSQEKPEPAVPIKKSVTPDYLVCLEDGMKLKVLKRHLRIAHNMTHDEYRQRWGLPAYYPIVAANYAKKRSILAKKFGLGGKPRKKAKKR